MSLINMDGDADIVDVNCKLEAISSIFVNNSKMFVVIIDGSITVFNLPFSTKNPNIWREISPFIEFIEVPPDSI